MTLYHCRSKITCTLQQVLANITKIEKIENEITFTNDKQREFHTKNRPTSSSFLLIYENTLGRRWDHIKWVYKYVYVYVLYTLCLCYMDSALIIILKALYFVKLFSLSMWKSVWSAVVRTGNLILLIKSSCSARKLLCI